MYKSNDDMVSHPSHYQSENGLEVIDVIEAFTFDLKGIEATDTGNIIKYICRWKKKNGLQDLKKAMWYLNHLIEHVEKMNKENTPRSNKCDFESNKDDIILWSKVEAEDVINRMEKIIETYGFVRVADLYDLVGITCNYIDNNYGWTNIRGAEPVRVRDGYVLTLPKAVPLKSNKCDFESNKKEND